MVKLILFLLFVVTAFGGIGLMVYGHRVNRKEGTKRYHPGNRFVNLGLAVVVASGLALVVLVSLGWKA